MEQIKAFRWNFHASFQQIHIYSFYIMNNWISVLWFLSKFPGTQLSCFYAFPVPILCVPSKLHECICSTCFQSLQSFLPKWLIRVYWIYWIYCIGKFCRNFCEFWVKTFPSKTNLHFPFGKIFYLIFHFVRNYLKLKGKLIVGGWLKYCEFVTHIMRLILL